MSTNTVSRVVRGDPEVADSTREKIAALIEELGYRPNYAARALVAKRTGVLHVVTAAPMFLGHGQTLLAVVTAAAEKGFHATVSNTWSKGEVASAEAPFRTDGVVILGGQASTVDLAQEIGREAPTVLLLAEEAGLGNVSTVSVDNARGSHLATAHLTGQGVRDLVHLAGPLEWADAQRRREGFERACRESGARGRVVPCGQWRASAGYAAVMALAELPEGIVAANDQLALGAMRALHERGARLPQDVRVVGFDDFDGVECFYPPLTTVRQPFATVGRRAIDQLVSLLEGGRHRDALIAPELVVRRSSRP